jgi:hypothetical protein
MRDQHGYEPPKGLVMRCPDCAIMGRFSYMTPTTRGGSKGPWGPGLGWWCFPTEGGGFKTRCGLTMPRKARLRDLPGYWLRYAKWWVSWAPFHVDQVRKYRWRVSS